jgi:fibro-slime domain-containing protein
MRAKTIKHSIVTGLGLITAAGLLLPMGTPTASANDDPFGGMPSTLVLTGVVRDFKERSVAGGHTDFERQPAAGFGHYMNNVEEYLDDEGKPQFKGGGKKVASQWKDKNNRPLHPSLFDASRGDIAGSWGATDNGGIVSAESFAQWFRTIPGVNMAKDLSITLVRQANSNVYVFDDRNDNAYKNLGGFFPINNQLMGNSPNNDKNFHFTYELATTFVYQPGQGQVFKFRGDDDVWVYVNGKCVIDIGGVHSAVEQTVELDRLDNLVAGGVNTLHFFFAERHRTQSNFRIETTINLRSAELPNTSHIYD